MKSLAFALIALLGLFYFVPNANAVVVCGAGYYWHRGGCVFVRPGPVVIAPPVYVAPPVYGPGPRCYWAYGRRVCRW